MTCVRNVGTRTQGSKGSKGCNNRVSLFFFFLRNSCVHIFLSRRFWCIFLYFFLLNLRHTHTDTRTHTHTSIYSNLGLNLCVFGVYILVEINVFKSYNAK